MSHNFTVDIALYDGSSTDQNPWVWIHGTVDGKSTAFTAIYWAAIQQAFAVAGQAGVQQLLAPFLLALVIGSTPPFPTIPTFQSSNIPAPVTSGPTAVICTQALVPPWSA
jgi:hypothetical protein